MFGVYLYKNKSQKYVPHLDYIDAQLKPYFKSAGVNMLFIVFILSQEERIYEYIVQVQYTVQLKVSKCVYLFINLKILILSY